MTTLTGTAGNDTLLGSVDGDVLDGSAGEDTLLGDAGNDTLIGGDGNDSLQGGPGSDVIDGGAGADAVDYHADPAGVTVVLVAGAATVTDGWGNIDALSNIENFTGSLYGDNFTGDAGDTSAFGLSGNDVINGGAGNDALHGNDGNDSLIGGAGNDSLYGDDSHLGETGNDTLIGGSGRDYLEGSGGNDWLVGDAGNDSLNGGTGADTLLGGAGADHLDGGVAGPDSVFDYASYEDAPTGVVASLATGTAQDGWGETDTLVNIDGLIGSAHADALTGGSDSRWFNGYKFEWFIGGAGNDTIDGGRGTTAAMDAGNFEINSVNYSTSTSGVNVDLAAGTASDGLGGTDTLIGINMVWGSAQADTLTGGNAAMDYTEQFEGGGGNDVIHGGSGIDWVMYRLSTSGANVNLTTGTATDGLGGTDTFTGIEGAIGSNYADTMLGGSGNEYFQGRAGNDSIDGGGGTDRIQYNGDYDANGDGLGVVVNLSSGTKSNSWRGVGYNLAAGTAVDGWGNTDTLSNIEDIRGSIYADVLFGSAGANVIDGWRGGDLLVGGAGNDTLDGGTVGPDNDFDYVSYLDAPTTSTGVTVNLGAGTATDGWGNTDTLLNIDGVYGSAYNDSLTGGSNSQWFSGLKFEWFIGGAGNDSIDGGRGTTVAMNAGNFEINLVRYHTSTSGVNVNLATGIASDGFGGTDTLTGINTVWGSNYADTLTGGNAAMDYMEQFNGSGGADTIDGGSGFDWITFRDSPSAAWVDMANGTATDGFDSDTVTVGIQPYTDTFSNIEGAIGSDHADTLLGGGANESFQGRAGNDSIDGGAGTDRIQYSSDYDADGDGFGVTLNLATGIATDGWGHTDTLANIENVTGSIYADILVGNGANNVIDGGRGNDSLLGGGGNDLLDGGRGADQMEGGSGNDLYLVDHRFDQISELADGGIDSVSAKAGHVLADNVENLFLTGSITLRSGGFFGRKSTTIDLNSDGTGNAADNLLRGNRGHNQLDGLGGNDTLLGGAGADVLQGGTGADRLVGGAGADVFAFGAGDGGAGLAAADMLYDFADGIDRIALTGGLSFADLTISQGTDAAAGNTIVRTNSGEYLAVLLNTTPNSVTALDFLMLNG